MMSDFHKALLALRPGVNFSNLDNTLANVRWDAPLPEGFAPPTQQEVDAELARLAVPASITRDQAMAELDGLGKLDAAFAMAQQAGGLTYQRWFNARWEYRDFLEPPLSNMAAALEIDAREFFEAAAVRP
jgi:hypothetical protein